MIMVSIGNTPEKRKSCKKALVWEEKTAGQKNISQYTMSPKTGLTDSMFWYGTAYSIRGHTFGSQGEQVQYGYYLSFDTMKPDCAAQSYSLIIRYHIIPGEPWLNFEWDDMRLLGLDYAKVFGEDGGKETRKELSCWAVVMTRGLFLLTHSDVGRAGK